jgi:hypothetical protein
MTRHDDQNFANRAIDPALLAGSPSSFRGPAQEGWAAFGWHTTMRTTSPFRSRVTITKAFHGPRRVR